MSDHGEKCCRICLDVEALHVNILGDPTISLHLKSCLSIVVSPSDNLPKAICVTCVTQLNQFYNFQLNARCSQDWLESLMQQRLKKSSETKVPIQPLPDSEYNSDSLLEFLNNTANIEEYLNNLGKEDIPSIVNMLDKNEHSTEVKTINVKPAKQPSPKKKDLKPQNCNIEMEIDVLDSDVEIVKEIIMKKSDSKVKANQKSEIKLFTCYGCKLKSETIQKLSQHMSTCEIATRTCMQCYLLFDSKLKMQQHSLTHNTTLPISCNCGEQFQSKERFMQHKKTCYADYVAAIGYVHRCKECGDTFKERFQLYKHARDHIMNADKRTCDICGHCFIGNDALIKHRKEEHEKPENSVYRCKVCNLTSSDHREIYIHVQSHLAKPEQNRHLCESCGQSFVTRASLIRHSSQHVNSHKCHVCSKQFKRKTDLDDHVSQHKETAMCERCGKTVSSYSFEVHVCV